MSMQHDHNQQQKILQQSPLISPKTPDEWKAHWKAQGQGWREESEISTQRQVELEKYRAILPNEEQGVYPFKDVQLNRADVEWLLATHENGRGPVIWSDESQRKRNGLDLRGADLNQKNDKRADLSGLPLSRLLSSFLQIVDTVQSQDEITVMGINLLNANLSDADLMGADLRGADLRGARLEGAFLMGANLSGANLSDAFLSGANLSGADLLNAKLTEATLLGANLTGADLTFSNLTGAFLMGANLTRVNLSDAQLERANLKDISLVDTHYVGPRIADIQWGNTNLAIVDWSHIALLLDEYTARQKQDDQGNLKKKDERLQEFKDAARANHQLTIALQSQGINDDAARFAYRAQASQKAVFWFQMIQSNIPLRRRLSYLGSWFFSWLIFLIAGYGYKFWRSLLTYLLVISGFALAYYLLGLHDIGAHNIPGPHHLSLYEAFVVSATAFHGRGFFTGTFTTSDPQAGVAAFEAFLGLLIEVTFIATLTQRLFNR